MAPRNLYEDEPPEDSEKKEREALERSRQRRERNRRYMRAAYTPRAEMDPETLAKVRAAANERQKKYAKRKRERMGLPPTGKPGRPRKKKDAGSK